jgi:hypothetical protein
MMRVREKSTDSLDVQLVLIARSHLYGRSIMANGAVVFHPRKRKANAETQECGIYDSAFLADRGCLFTLAHMKKKSGSVRLEQTQASLHLDRASSALHARLEA